MFKIIPLSQGPVLPQCPLPHSTCMHTHVHINTWELTHAHTRLPQYVHANTQRWAHTYACTTSSYAYIHREILACTQIQIKTQSSATHTYTCTHKHKSRCGNLSQPKLRSLVPSKTEWSQWPSPPGPVVAPHYLPACHHQIRASLAHLWETSSWVHAQK